MSEFAIEVEGLAKAYREGDRETPVLKNVSLRVKPGETVAIVGASGAGKSTLLHCIGGLDDADAGRVVVDGVDIGGMDEKARGDLRNRRLGFVYQFHHLLPEFTALENVAMPLYIRRTPEAEANAAAKAVLEEIGLGERLDHLPSQLSGGDLSRLHSRGRTDREPRSGHRAGGLGPVPQSRERKEHRDHHRDA